MGAGREFIDKVTRLAIAAITLFGFTTSIEDEDIPDEAKRQIEERINITAHQRKTGNQYFANSLISIK